MKKFLLIGLVLLLIGSAGWAIPITLNHGRASSDTPAFRSFPVKVTMEAYIDERFRTHKIED